jgi:hypothetical protein
MFFLALLALEYLHKETFLVNHHLPIHSCILRLGTGMPGLFTDIDLRNGTSGEHASIIQNGKRERISALLVDSACLALGGL